MGTHSKTITIVESIKAALKHFEEFVSKLVRDLIKAIRSIRIPSFKRKPKPDSCSWCSAEKDITSINALEFGIDEPIHVCLDVAACNNRYWGNFV